jgi:hypothetical protein
MGSAGRAGPWIRATSKGFGYVAAFSPLIQRPVRCAGAASTIRPHYSSFESALIHLLWRSEDDNSALRGRRPLTEEERDSQDLRKAAGCILSTTRSPKWKFR